MNVRQAQSFMSAGFKNAEFSVHKTFGKLGQGPLEDSLKDALEQYVCLLYQLCTSIVGLKELRWWMFHREQAESTTRAAFLKSTK